MTHLSRYILKIALRSRIFHVTYLLLALGLIMSLFLGNTMLIEESHFAAVFFANFARLLINFGLIAFITTNICQLYNNKEIELLLSKRISKTQFVMSYYLSIIILALWIVVPLFVFLEIMKIIFNFNIELSGLIIWSISLFAEVVIISTFTFFIALFIRSNVVTMVLSSCFYILCRLYGFFLNAINNPESITNTDAMTMVMGKIFKFIGIFFPRLDLLNQSEWLIYGMQQSLSLYSLVVFNCFLSSAFILFLTIYEFRKREL